MKVKTVLTGVLQDIHRTGLRVLEYALEQEGFKVVHAGRRLTQEDFIQAAQETNADAILISSLYGHALFDIRDFREKCTEAGLQDVLIYIGGNLVVSGQNLAWDDIEKQFKDMGISRAYPPTTLPEKVIDDLKRDLGMY